MTVRDLLQALQGCDLDTLVVLSADGEGNHFSPLSEADTDTFAYVAENAWSGEIGLRELTEDLQRKGYSCEDVVDPQDGAPAVVLWPTN
jgi:hypothetical protein